MDSVSEPGASNSDKKQQATSSHTRKLKLKDANAPKAPVSGYVLYLTERRQQVSQENPSLSMADVTKLLAAQWKEMPADQKQKYQRQFEESKKQYQEELAKYKKTASYKKFQQKLKAKGALADESVSDMGTEEDVAYAGSNIPIFTKEFLEHNKARETELRKLRREVTQLEEENSALEAYIAKVNAAIAESEKSTNEHREMNNEVRAEVKRIKQKLIKAFARVHLPGTNEGANSENIDAYMANLTQLLTNNPSHHQEFIARVRNIAATIRID